MKKNNTSEIREFSKPFNYRFRLHGSIIGATKGFFRIFLNATVALILLIGNSSFTLLTYSQEIDSAKISLTEESLALNDKQGLKISIPTRNMIRRADIEINRNMNEWIRMINHLKIPQLDPFEGDKQISKNFLASFFLCLTFADPEDEFFLNMLFHAENIRLIDTKPFLGSDSSIDNMFKSALYTNNKSYKLIESDLITTSTFHTENP
jgi:hypothetical protein